MVGDDVAPLRSSPLAFVFSLISLVGSVILRLGRMIARTALGMSAMKLLLCRLLILGVLLAVTGRAQSQPAYTYSTLDVPGYAFTSASGINDAGQIVGYSSTWLA